MKAIKLLNVAKELLVVKRTQESLQCSLVAYKLAPPRCVLSVLIRINIIDVEMNDIEQSGKSKKEMVRVLQDEYVSMKAIVAQHLTADHPLHLNLTDKMVLWLSLLSFQGLSFEYLKKSMSMA